MDAVGSTTTEQVHSTPTVVNKISTAALAGALAAASVEVGPPGVPPAR
ncbi:hypothetical protein [Streptomyces sp. NPDC055632]